MIDRADVAEALKSAGLDFAEVDGLWSLKFAPTVEGREAEPTYLYVGGKEYLFAFSIVEAIDLDTLDADVLRRLIRVASSTNLAKLEYANTDDGRGILVASSECAVDGLNGPKLRRRLEACAALAADLKRALDPSNTP